VFSKENERTNASAGDIFFTSVGSLGRSCVYDGSMNICFQRSVSVITTLIYNQYLKFFFDCGYFQQKVIREATGTAQKGFYLNQLSASLIPVPPLNEQKRIVDEIKKHLPYVHEYDAKKQELDKLNEEFPEALKKSILQEAVMGRLVPQDPNDEPASALLEKIRAEKQRLIAEGNLKKDKNESIIYRRDNSHYEKLGDVERCIDDEIPFDIPESWAWCRLGSILLKLTDGAHTTPKYTKTGVPFISVKDVSSGVLSFENCKYISEEEHRILYDRCNPQKGDILLTKVGTTGIPVIVDTDMEFSLFVSVALLKFDNRFLDIQYLINLINSPLVQLQATENTRGVGNKNWVMRDIANTLIAVPPLQEQHRIVEKIDIVTKPLISL
jgi:type I restriction enzyme S subunit